MLIVDNEIYRYLPSIVVSTIDKMAMLGTSNDFRTLFGQVKTKCRIHGFSSGTSCSCPSCNKSSYQIRKEQPSNRYERAARFFYLNAYSYNGLYRVNKQGKYNVPYGHRSTRINFDRLIEVSEKLKDVELINQDFEGVKDFIGEGDLVFLDPPYAVSKESNCFIKYNSTLFSIDDQYRLARFIDYIDSQGAYFILTNAAHETILEIFKGKGRLVTLERNSLIGGKNSYRGKVQEYIFTNIPEKR